MAIRHVEASETGKRMARFGLPTIVWLVLAVSAAGAQDITGMAPGAAVANTVTIGDKQVPLPRGAWTLVRSEAKRRGNLGKIGSAFLIQETGESGFSAIYMRSNVEVSSCTGWTRWKSYCDRTNTHHNESDRNYNPRDAECWNVNHVILDPYSESKSKFLNEVNKFLKDRINVTDDISHERIFQIEPLPLYRRKILCGSDRLRVSRIHDRQMEEQRVAHRDHLSRSAAEEIRLGSQGCGRAAQDGVGPRLRREAGRLGLRHRTDIRIERSAPGAPRQRGAPGMPSPMKRRTG